MSIEISTTVFGHSPSDAMQVLGVGELPVPAACVVCGNGTNEFGYLFLGVHVDFHGALLLCATCLLQGGEKFGLMGPDVAKAIHNQAVELAAEVTKLRKENEVYRERLTVFESALRDISSDPVGSSSSTDLDSVEVKSPEQLATEAAESDSSEPESEPAESSEGDGLSEPSATSSGDLTAKPRKRTTIKNVRIV